VGDRVVIEGSIETLTDRWFTVLVVLRRLKIYFKVMNHFQILQNVLYLYIVYEYTVIYFCTEFPIMNFEKYY